MKICHVITSLLFGGAEKLLVNLTHHHVANHEIHIVYFKGEPKLKQLLHPAVNVHQIPLNRQLPHNLRAFIKELAPDVVHTHLGHADLIGLWAIRGLPLKRICTMHNIYFKFNWKDKLFFGAYQFLFKTVAKDTRVVSISKAVEEHVLKVLKVKRSHSHLLYNGIPNLPAPIDKNEARKELGIDQGKTVALFIGRLSLQKSVDTLVEAAGILKRNKQAAELQIIIIGEGTERPKLEALAQKEGVEDFLHFAGVTYTPEKYLAAADFFVLPSVFEGMGIVIIEAFRAGIPVLSTNIEGPAELVEHGVHGFLVEPKDSQALATRMNELATDPALRQTMGKAAFERFAGRFDITHYAEKLEDVYSK